MDGKQHQLNKYIAWLRHTYTNYDKYLGIMYDELGNQTELRKYVNNLLWRVMTDQLDAEKTLAQIKHLIKIANKKSPQKPVRKSKVSDAKRDRRKRNKQARKARENDIRWGKAVAKHNRKLEQEEEQIHQQYVQIMLSKIGLAKVQIRKKLLPRPTDVI